MWSKRVMIGIALGTVLTFVVMAIMLWFGLQDRARAELSRSSATVVAVDMRSMTDEG